MKFCKLLLSAVVVFFLFSTATFAASKQTVTACGADPTGVKDSSAAIQTCINLGGSEAAIYFPPGQYLIKNTLTVSNNNVTLYSDARATAKLMFSGCGDLIKFSKDTNVIYNGGVRGLWLQGDGSSCSQTGIHVSDGSWITIEDAQISGFYGDTSQASTGIFTNGREGFNVRNVFIEASNPIVLARNPNHPYLDADHFHFENIYTTIPANTLRWHIALQDSVSVSNMTIDGQNPMAGGCGIVQWLAPTPSVSVSNHLKIANVRHEQMAAGCDKEIDIELAMQLQTLVIDNVALSGPFPLLGTAIFLKSVDGLTVRNTTYLNNVGTLGQEATFINASGTKYIQLENNSVYPYSKNIDAKDLNGLALVWKAGPYTGKECCYQNRGSGPWIRTPDSGILGQP